MSLVLTNLVGFCAKRESGCSCTPAYVTGNRTGSITASAHGFTAQGGGATALVDGSVSDNSTNSIWFPTGQNVAGISFRYDFGASSSIKVTEILWKQSTSSTHGTWRVRASDDASSWTTLGSDFTLGGSTDQTITEPAANTTGYRYYEIYGVSGTGSNTPYLREVEFKQCTC